MPDKLHIAVAGWTGVGKSAMINAFRAVTDTHPSAAHTGVSETTMKIGRYPDPDPKLPFSRFVWYDLPGAGTPNISSHEYARKQALYIFDVVVLVIGDRFVEADANLLKHCSYFDVPTFIVRSRADTAIADIQAKRNQAEEFEEVGEETTGGTSNERQGDFFDRKTPLMELKDGTDRMVQSGLKAYGLPPQRIYFVSRYAVQWVLGYLHGKRYRRSPELYDAEDFVRAVLTETYIRRYPANSKDVEDAMGKQSSSNGTSR
jgi:GTP-binding protein EngB required for normal cell division